MSSRERENDRHDAPTTVDMPAVGGAPAVSKPRTLQGIAAPSEPPRSARDSVKTDLGFVPPPDAPKVELAPSLAQEAALAASFPPPQPKPKRARQPAAPTEVVPEIQKRRAKKRREKSDLPLTLGLIGLAVLIALLLGAITYGVIRMTQ
jgi:hypothetical protein